MNIEVSEYMTGNTVDRGFHYFYVREELALMDYVSKVLKIIQISPSNRYPRSFVLNKGYNYREGGGRITPTRENRKSISESTKDRMKARRENEKL